MVEDAVATLGARAVAPRPEVVRARLTRVQAVDIERGVGVDRVAAAGVHLEVEVGAGHVAGGADVPITWPGRTVAPTEMPNSFWWQYHSSVPSGRVSIVRLP